MKLADIGISGLVVHDHSITILTFSRMSLSRSMNVWRAKSNKQSRSYKEIEIKISCSLLCIEIAKN